MGLDLLDLGFRIERAFHVRLDWGEVIPDGGEPTAGDLFAHVLDRLGPNDNPGRVADVFFRRLRAGTALRSGLLHFLTLPLAVRFPPDCETVGGLAGVLLREHYGLLRTRERVWHREEVWHILQGVLADALNVEPERVTPTARIVSDLGAD